MRIFQAVKVLFLGVTLSSCSSAFWSAMGTGLGNYGGGMYGGGASMYSGVPYGLQPNVAADAAAKTVMNNVTSNIWNNGVPVTPVPTSGGGSYVNSSSGSSQSSSAGSGHRCRLCNGTGRKVRESWASDKTSTKWCSECKKSVGMGHSHTSCDLCGGDGWCD